MYEPPQLDEDIPISHEMDIIPYFQLPLDEEILLNVLTKEANELPTWLAERELYGQLLFRSNSAIYLKENWELY